MSRNLATVASGSRMLLISLFLSTLIGCGGGGKRSLLPPVVREETVHDLRDLFEEANIEVANPEAPPHPDGLFVGVKRAQVKGGGNRPVVLLPPPASVSYDLELPDSPCEFRFALGLGIKPEQPPGKVGFRVLIDDELQLEKELAPGPDGGWVDWVEAKVDLRPMQGKRIKITLQTTCSPEDEAKMIPAGFAVPVIVTRKELPRLESRPDQMNVLLVLVDTLRADHLSCYGYSRPTSPRLDELVTKSALYTNAISQAPWTWPATASILTSLYPNSHGVVEADQCYLAEEAETLAEAFQNRGFSTWGISSNSLICEAQNFDQGFETFQVAAQEPANVLTDKFLEWLPTAEKSAFFAYLHYLDPHYPYDPPHEARMQVAPELFGPDAQAALERIDKGQVTMAAVQGLEGDKEHVVGLYDGEIRHWDTHFGRILDTLKEKNLLSRTLIVVTSDHGEEFWEHGHCGHSKTLYQELLHVPLIVHDPRKPTAIRVDSLVETIDIYPTLCRATDITPGRGISGRVLPGLPGITSGTPPDGMAFSSTCMAWKEPAGRMLVNQQAIVTDDLKLIRRQKKEGSEEHLESLFDLKNDPGEKSDISTTRKNDTQMLASHLAKWLQDHPLRRGSKQAWISETLRQKLEALGYMEEEDQNSPKGKPEEN